MRIVCLVLIAWTVAIAQNNSTTPSPATKTTAMKVTSAARKSTASKTTSLVSKSTAAKSTSARSATAKGTSATRVPTKSTTSGALAARRVPAVKPNLLNPATLNAKAPAVFRVRLTTSKGPVLIEVTRAWTPNGADRFYNLVRAGFFTDMYFFRVVAGFMAQFGMSSSPEISQVWRDATIPDDPAIQSNTRGMVTFAKSGAPNSRSTQFFVNYGDNSRLDAMGFAPFGKVIEGMDAIDALYSAYGERSNDQTAIRAQGKAFFDASYPLLDKIVTATIVPLPAAPARPAATGVSGATRPRPTTPPTPKAPSLPAK